MKLEGYVMGSSQTKPLVEIDDNVVLDPVINQDHPNFGDYKKKLIDNDTQYRNNHKLILEHYQEVKVSFYSVYDKKKNSFFSG